MASTVQAVHDHDYQQQLHVDHVGLANKSPRGSSANSFRTVFVICSRPRPGFLKSNSKLQYIVSHRATIASAALPHTVTMNSSTLPSTTHAEMAGSTGATQPVHGTEPDAIRLADDVLEKMANNVDDIALITQEANASTSFEKKMTIGQAIRMYPKAAFFALTLSMSLVMEGYDTSLLGSFFGYPTFQEKFGHGPLPDGTYQLTASWQSGLQAGVQVRWSMMSFVVFYLPCIQISDTIPLDAGWRNPWPLGCWIGC